MTAVKERDLAILRAIQDGLPLVPRPYEAIGAVLGMEEAEVIARLERMRREGTIKRFGLIVRHRRLGYTANAMVVWDIPDDRVDEIAVRLARHEPVTLCYRRPRRLPDWPYNLFCMIHGRSREEVHDIIGRIVAAEGLESVDRAVLFSWRCFKQCGARFGAPAGSDPAAKVRVA